MPSDRTRETLRAYTRAFEALAYLQIAFGNQTISPAKFKPRKIGLFIRRETHGFASLPHGKFAFIVYNRRLRKELCCASDL